MKTKTFCAEESKEYNKIVKEKHNRKILPNGDIRIGNDMAISKKTNLIYTIK
mgnify:CR=1 FL=1